MILWPHILGSAFQLHVKTGNRSFCMLVCSTSQDKRVVIWSHTDNLKRLNCKIPTRTSQATVLHYINIHLAIHTENKCLFIKCMCPCTKMVFVSFSYSNYCIWWRNTSSTFLSWNLNFSPLIFRLRRAGNLVPLPIKITPGYFYNMYEVNYLLIFWKSKEHKEDEMEL